MAKVEQKVGLDTKDYRRGIREMASQTRKSTDQVGEALNDAGNKSRDFTERVSKNNKKASSSFNDLFKGIKGGIGVLGLGAVGVAVGGAISKGVGKSLSFTEVLNRAAVRTGQSEFEQAQFRNQLIDISDRTDVDKEELAAAALNAINLGASAKEALKFAEVIGKVSRAFDDVDPAAFSEKVAKDLRARGQEVTAENTRKSVEALLVGTRQGLGDINEAFAQVAAVPGRVQQRAGLSQRDLVTLFAGAQGVAADPAEVTNAIRTLISATDDLRSAAAVQGILGTQLRDQQGKFTLTIENLDDIATTLKGIGTEQQQRAVLETIPGFDQQAVEGLLALVQDRSGFQRQRELAERDKPKLDVAFEKSTEGFASKVSNVFNEFLNAFSRESKFEDRPGQGKFGQRIGLTPEEVERARQEVSPLARPQDIERRRQEREAQQLESQRNQPQEVKVMVEIDSKDPGFVANPKSTDLSRDPGGF